MSSASRATFSSSKTLRLCLPSCCTYSYSMHVGGTRVTICATLYVCLEVKTLSFCFMWNVATLIQVLNVLCDHLFPSVAQFVLVRANKEAALVSEQVPMDGWMCEHAPRFFISLQLINPIIDIL